MSIQAQTLTPTTTAHRPASWWAPGAAVVVAAALVAAALAIRLGDEAADTGRVAPSDTAVVTEEAVARLEAHVAVLESAGAAPSLVTFAESALLRAEANALPSGQSGQSGAGSSPGSTVGPRTVPNDGYGALRTDG